MGGGGIEGGGGGAIVGGGAGVGTAAVGVATAGTGAAAPPPAGSSRGVIVGMATAAINASMMVSASTASAIASYDSTMR